MCTRTVGLRLYLNFVVNEQLDGPAALLAAQFDAQRMCAKPGDFIIDDVRARGN